ncbi:MAG: 23S rRNA (cytidine(2498)-2'-O)-methyltransferase RlmM [Hydrogenophilaceae bacterium]|nr:23S rRNA (cytidine(2498)-2'-O)-methyltransferase RlmM [Hydrogenophilaceae bacterium]
MNQEASSCLLLYCRAGFEKECAQDITQACENLGIAGWCKASPNAGYVMFHPTQAGDMATLQKRLRFEDLTFSRQMIFARGPLALQSENRLPPLVEAARSLLGPFGQLWLETADTNEAKELSAFCRKFEPHLKKALIQANLLKLDVPKLPRLHVFFLDSSTAWAGTSQPGHSSNWPMGIPRLRMPRGAPSRSTLKLAEALLEMLSEQAREQLRPGRRAIDLGASPGGWTWQLVQRGMKVTAVDNGPMDATLMESGLVEHLRADGFTFRPRYPIDWLVCDMVDKPARVVDLVARWFERGDCRAALFNLKLPMKRRFEEVQLARNVLESRLESTWRIRMRQLYHDREEITCLIVRENG